MRKSVIVLALVSAACATSQTGSSGPVSRAEILAADARNAYEALQELRPRWLQRTSDGGQLAVVRRRGSPPPVTTPGCGWTVYIGDTGATGDDLRNLPIASILELRLIPARARRPDRSTCSHDRPAIHVVLIG